LRKSKTKARTIRRRILTIVDPVSSLFYQRR
jgi:hypothetical protein